MSRQMPNLVTKLEQHQQNRNKKGGWLFRHPPSLRLGGWGNPSLFVSAERSQRPVPQHPEVPVQRMLSFEERKDRRAPRR
jgi:hypothetical protein